jgi:hypothetical protein
VLVPRAVKVFRDRHPEVEVGLVELQPRIRVLTPFRPAARAAAAVAPLDPAPQPLRRPDDRDQVELLLRLRAGDEEARLPLMRSIAGIAAALRNTG